MSGESIKIMLLNKGEKKPIVLLSKIKFFFWFFSRENLQFKMGPKAKEPKAKVCVAFK